MAARVTKLFLQNCATEKEDTSKSGKRSAAKGKATAVQAASSNNAKRKLRQKGKKVSAKVRVLEEARRELEQADRTAENLRKLKTKAPTKSQRLMAKVLAQRNAAFR
ncbi:lysosomal cobalamin transporter [Phytophthora cinnamomi]|uniref:lysosomal cobalamin transporter n=1 Tax=Phytophthora cinnamomi TaxID=4785 RepID=UPI003559791E|nr:lysosomal cobalamin transporter [Phytophthora cinnamomi]